MYTCMFCGAKRKRISKTNDFKFECESEYLNRNSGEFKRSRICEVDHENRVLRKQVLEIHSDNAELSKKLAETTYQMQMLLIANECVAVILQRDPSMQIKSGTKRQMAKIVKTKLESAYQRVLRAEKKKDPWDDNSQVEIS